MPVGYQIGAWHFTPGQYVDTQSHTKGKGTEGAMQRWNFGGQCASHGASKSHRSLGATGAHTDPAKVFKNKKMHGRGGNKQKTHFNYQVYKIDVERCLVYLKGMVPGPRGSIIKIRDAFFNKRHNHTLVNYPTFIPQDGQRYASIVQVLPPKEDQNEQWLHDNALPKQVTEEVAE